MEFNFKKILIVIFVFLSIFTGIILTGNHNLIYNEVPCYSAESNLISENTKINSQEDPIKSFSQDFPIFGYKINPKAADPIDTDHDGILTVTKNKLNFIDIILNLEFGYYIYEDMPITGTQNINSNNEIVFSYEIEDPLRNFFLDIFIGTKVIYIDLAFIGDNYELIYEGVDSIEQDEFNYIFTQKVEVLNSDINLKVEQIFDLYSSNDEFLLSETIDIMKKQQIDNIRIYQNEQRNTIQTLGITVTNYGIAYEIYYIAGIDLPPDLPDDYWEDHTEIDIGIYRFCPTENVIEADLQYYNMDYFTPKYAWKRNVKALAMYTHSNSTWNTKWSVSDGGENLFRPSEVRALWYHLEIGLENWAVYPTDMIILANVCFGYSGDDGIPRMAKAFVDYGGTAFIGCTTLVPTRYNDDFNEDFWTSLCQDDETIEDATLALIDEHNDHVGDFGGWYKGYNLDITWVYGNHIKIYGNEDKKLDN